MSDTDSLIAKFAAFKPYEADTAGAAEAAKRRAEKAEKDRQAQLQDEAMQADALASADPARQLQQDILRDLQHGELPNVILKKALDCIALLDGVEIGPAGETKPNAWHVAAAKLYDAGGYADAKPATLWQSDAADALPKLEKTRNANLSAALKYITAKGKEAANLAAEYGAFEARLRELGATAAKKGLTPPNVAPPEDDRFTWACGITIADTTGILAQLAELTPFTPGDDAEALAAKALAVVADNITDAGFSDSFEGLSSVKTGKGAGNSIAGSRAKWAAGAEAATARGWITSTTVDAGFTLNGVAQTTDVYALTSLTRPLWKEGRRRRAAAFKAFKKAQEDAEAAYKADVEAAARAKGIDFDVADAPAATH